MVFKIKTNFPFTLSFLFPISVEENNLCVLKIKSPFSERGPEFVLKDFVCFP